MSAQVITELFPLEETTAPRLRLVQPGDAPVVYSTGLKVSERRALRQARQRRQRRLAMSMAVVAAIAVLALPGHVFGASSAAAASTDVVTSANWSSGSVYVVQPGDTLNSITAMVNPVNPAAARAALVNYLDSTTVVVGEHIEIP